MTSEPGQSAAPKLRRRILRVATFLTALSLAVPAAPSYAAGDVTSSMQLLVTDATTGEPVASGAPGSSVMLNVYLKLPTVIPSTASQRKVFVSWQPFDGAAVAQVQELAFTGYDDCSSPRQLPCTPYYYASMSAPNMSASGTWTVQYDGSALHETASQASVSFDVWKAQTRREVDAPDSITGWQVKPVYVVPADGTDRARDMSGQLSSWMNQLQRFLSGQVGRTWSVDRTVDGAADVAYMRSSYPAEVLLGADSKGRALLTAEWAKTHPAGSERKVYVFYVEGTAIALGNQSWGCGYTVFYATSVLVTTGAEKTCTGAYPSYDRQVTTTVHEILHTLGVAHVDSLQDLMRPSLASFPGEFDPTRTQYYGGNAAGVDTKGLRIWSDNSTLASAAWPCHSEGTAAATKYFCVLGTTSLSPYQGMCWKAPIPGSVLQVKRGSKWVTLAPASFKIGADCTGKYPYAVRARITSTTPGISSYRFKHSTGTSKPFTVTWQR